MIHFYDLLEFRKMLADTARVEAYSRALEAAIRPECIVLEIGTGLGYFAMLSAKLGAKKVYAVELNPVIRIGREIASANHLSDKIEFFEAYSTALELPEKADICLSDMTGALPFFEGHIPSIVDARQRLLKADAMLIPQSDKIFITCVEAKDFYSSLRWDLGDGLDYSAAHRYSMNQLYKYRPKPEESLSDVLLLAQLDYATVQSPNWEAKLRFTARHDGLMHGYCLWFERDLGNGISFSTAPDRPESIYGNLFLPLEAPLELKENDEVVLHFRLNYQQNDYIYSWQTQHKATHYQQSSFWGRLYHSDAIFGHERNLP